MGIKAVERQARATGSECKCSCVPQMCSSGFVGKFGVCVYTRVHKRIMFAVPAFNLEDGVAWRVDGHIWPWTLIRLHAF